MARIARKYLETSFFHVMVQGIQKEYIFNKPKFIRKYLKLLKQYTEELNIEIIAYCIMSNHAHMLLYTEDIDAMTKLMHKINTIYAQYYNKNKERVGYVFRNRFKSEPIANKRYLIQCIKYIHQNPVKAHMVTKCQEYRYSSYNEYKKHKKFFSQAEINEIITPEDYKIICDNTECTKIFIDEELDRQEIINGAIREFIEDQEKSLVEIFIDRQTVKKLVKYLKEEKGLKYIEIMEELSMTTGIIRGLKK